MTILALDFETTGLDPKTCAPVSLGLAVLTDGMVMDREEWRFGFNPLLEWTAAAERIHGIKPTDLAKEPEECEVVRLVADWLRAYEAADLPIVSHNALFDQGFYAQWMYRVRSADILSGPWHCTKRMASRHLSLRNNKLDTVADHYGMERTGEHHGALEDAILCGKVWFAIRDDAQVPA